MCQHRQHRPPQHSQALQLSSLGLHACHASGLHACHAPGLHVCHACMPMDPMQKRLASSQPGSASGLDQMTPTWKSPEQALVALVNSQLDTFGPDDVILEHYKLLGASHRIQGSAQPRNVHAHVHTFCPPNQHVCVYPLE